jgi:hypothetical protein
MNSIYFKSSLWSISEKQKQSLVERIISYTLDDIISFSGCLAFAKNGQKSTIKEDMGRKNQWIQANPIN